MGRRGLLLVLAAVFLACTGPSGGQGGDSFPPLFEEAGPFLRAIREAKAPVRAEKITGLTVPHHLLAADLMAEAFAQVAGQGYTRVVILSPDHFGRSPTAFAVSQRDFQTALGPVGIDAAAVREVLQHRSVAASNLFSHEHGVQALLPFLAHYFPDAKVLALAISRAAKPSDWEALAETLVPLLTPQTLVIQSTDFSHYLPAAAARARDQETLRVLSGGEPEGVLALREPAHLDSKAAQYLQLRLQRRVFQARPTVVANRNSQEYTTEPLERTTSYIVQLYSPTNLRAAGVESYFFAGDTFLGRFIPRRLANGRFQADLTATILQITGGATLIVNLEGVMLPECPAVVGPYELCMRNDLTAAFLTGLNVRAVSLANNHSQDFGPAAYQAMVRRLTGRGIMPLEKGDIRDFGHFRLGAFTDVDNRSPQKAALLRLHDLQGLDNVKRDKPLFAFLHWGQEYTNAPGPREEALIAALQAKGVELLIGCHPHRAGALVCGPENCLAFSLGNFIFDQNAPGISGALLEAMFFPQGTYFLRWHPIGNLYAAPTSPELAGP